MTTTTIGASISACNESSSGIEALDSNSSDPRLPPPPLDPDTLLSEWKTLPQSNPTHSFPTYLIPKRHIQTALNLVPSHFLASQFGTDQLHTRIKAVAPHEDDELLQLRVNAPLSADVHEALVGQCEATLGSPREITFSYHDCTANYLLNQLLPAEALPPPTSFETIGRIAHLNLHDEYHWKYRKLIGDVFYATLGHIDTCLAKVGQVQGPYRTYEYEVLAGAPDTYARLKESGLRLEFDVAQVYWCSRLQEERQRLLSDWFQPHQTIADPFCGVGALLLLAAKKKKCRIWANDWNPQAIEALAANAARNGVALDRVQCGDAYDFLMDLGLLATENGLPDHVVMNYPVEAPTFLGALRWWPILDDDTKTWVHVYTFARQSGERAAELVAIDLIADNLLPATREELDERYGCQVSVHAVRDVAPGKVVYCVSFCATSKLLRSMQGDFFDEDE